MDSQTQSRGALLITNSSRQKRPLFKGTTAIALSLFSIPWARDLAELIVPMGCLGIGSGMVESTMMPHLAYLADLRHIGVYGNVYAIGDWSYCIAFAVGPILAGPIAKAGEKLQVVVVAVVVDMFVVSAVFVLVVDIVLFPYFVVDVDNVVIVVFSVLAVVFVVVVSAVVVGFTYTI